MMKQSYIYTFVIVLFSTMYRTDSKVILANEDMDSMIEFTSTSSYCRILTDKETIKFIYNERPSYVKIVPNDYFQYMIKKCDEPLDAFQRGLKFIYPGTYWCGPGNVARNYSELGVHEAEDSCCRDHDNCPLGLEGKQCINGICNESSFTRSYCECDDRFQKCLQDANTETANTIGAIFFNVARIICFRGKDNCDINDNDNCQIEFIENEQYKASQAPYRRRNIKAYYLNKFLRSLRLLK